MRVAYAPFVQYYRWSEGGTYTSMFVEQIFTSTKLAHPCLNVPPHPTSSDCASFVLFCAMVINICACMVMFLFYIFLGPAEFALTYPHNDIELILFAKSLDFFCAYLCRPPRRRYCCRLRERRCFVGRPTSRLPTHSSKL